ncbi:hypothetical protein H2248_003020 [Termitomyces sp. 'cryptogamus']|nr:hypothetical protein H2248_003020 [Termitomyces sp. 'cryptogamus']
MMSHREAINDKLETFRLASPTPQPLILLFDHDKRIPPDISIHIPEAFDQFSYLDMVKVPMLLPCIRVRYGTRYRYRDLPLPSDLSGQLFGWFEQPEITN